VTFPHWYICTVTVLLGIIAGLGSVTLFLLISARLIDRMSNLLKFHNAFLAFIVPYLRKQAEKKGGAR
jgi:hypothetical protein